MENRWTTAASFLLPFPPPSAHVVRGWWEEFLKGDKISLFGRARVGAGEWGREGGHSSDIGKSKGRECCILLMLWVWRYESASIGIESF